jgi:DNA-binding LytR/AlgR family response regulator
MSARSANAVRDEEVGAVDRSGARRRQGLPVPAVRPVEQRGDRMLENLRRRDPGRARALNTKLRTLSKVLVGERERRLYILAPDQIEYIESRGNYVEFHAGGLPFISRDSLKRLSRVLAAEGYLRIQRTLLLNLRSIVYAQRVGHGRFAFTLSSGARLCSGSKFRLEILQVLPLSRVQHDADS